MDARFGVSLSSRTVIGPAPLSTIVNRIHPHVMPKKPKRPTVDALSTAMAMPDQKSAIRGQVFEDYCFYTPTCDELPVLQKALRHADFVIVRAAAQSIAKLGPEAKDAADDLYDAAWRQDPVLLLPQAYSEALDALISIGAE